MRPPDIIEPGRYYLVWTRSRRFYKVRLIREQKNYFLMESSTGHQSLEDVVYAEVDKDDKIWWTEEEVKKGLE